MNKNTDNTDIVGGVFRPLVILLWCGIALILVLRFLL